jgi:hypothetical protein
MRLYQFSSSKEENHCFVISTIVCIYTGSSVFDSRLEAESPDRGVLCLFSNTPGKLQIFQKMGHDCILPNTSDFVIHNHPLTRLCITYRIAEISLNALRMSAVLGSAKPNANLEPL